jgi:RsiW-degrading membrane proteinase PrsW (M82 family)
VTTPLAGVKTGFLTLLLALLVVMLVALTGCRDHLAGTHDAQLEYQVSADPESAQAQATSSSDASKYVKWRLTAAQVTADVEAVGADRVRVTIDQDLAEFADDLLHWRGGVSVFKVDPSFAFVPLDPGELVQKTAPAEGGATERYYVGTRARIATAVRGTKTPKGHLVFSERMDDDQWRTRAVLDPPAVELFGKTELRDLANADKGRALSMTFTSEGAAALATAAKQSPGAAFAVVRGRSLLAVIPADSLAQGALVVPFGKDIYSFTSAHYTKRLLAGGNVPPLRRVAATTLATSWGPAIACVVLPLLCSLGWLFFVRQFDRGRPEPWWLVLSTFALGGLSVAPAALIEWALQSWTPYLDPTVMSLGGQLIGFPSALLVFAIVVGVVEEGAKFLGAWSLARHRHEFDEPVDGIVYGCASALLVFAIVVGVVEEGAKFLGAWSLARHRHEFDEPVDGIVYGCASALGFAAMENVKYFASTRLSGGVVAARAFLSVPAHMFFGAIWGYALGRTLVSRKTSVLLWVLGAAVIHGAFDTFLTIDGMQLFAIALNVGLGIAFVWFLRKSLRYGAIMPGGGDVPASSARAFYRMGSTTRFVVFTVLLVVLAAMLMSFGTTYEVFRHRIGFVFIAIASVFLALFGIVAYFLTEAVPLDAAIDNVGVTFAGATTRWSEIFGLERIASRGVFGGARAWVRLRTKDGVMRLGPSDVETAERLALAIESHLDRP